MRSTWFALTIVVLTLSPLATAFVPHPQALVVNQFPSGTALLTWTPLVGATIYVVLKGPSLDQLVAVDRTSATFYADPVADPTDVYVVQGTSLFGQQAIQGGASGDCVTTSTSTYQVAVTLENCLKVY